MINGWTRTEKQNFAKDKSYSTKLTEFILAVFFSYQYSNALYIENITRWREDMNFIFEWQNNILFFKIKYFFFYETPLDITGN